MNKFNLLKYLSKWKYLIFAVCVLGALIVYKYAMYNQEYTASTVISYTGQNAADGKTPSGDDIDVTEIYSAAVITDVLEDLNLNIGADAIRSKCKVTEIIPPDEEVKKQALLEAGEEYTYFPTDYVVSFSVGSEYSQDFARTVLDSIIKNYFATYGEKYINQQTLPNNNVRGSDGQYDYIERVEILDAWALNISDYLAAKKETQPNYRSAETGYSFSDLYEIYKSYIDYDIPQIYSLILEQEVTGDKETLIKKYQSDISTYELDLQNMEEKINDLNDLITKYSDKNKEGVEYHYGTQSDEGNDASDYILKNVYDEWNQEDGHVQSETTYDTLINEYVDIETEKEKLEVDLEHKKKLLAVFTDGAQSEDMSNKDEIEQSLEELSQKLGDMYSSVSTTVDEYNQYIGAYNVSTLSSISTSEKINVRMYIVLAIIIFFFGGCIGAIILGRSKDFLDYIMYTDRKTGLPNRAMCDIEIEKYARDMFDAGSNLREKSAKEIFYQDFKKFNDSNINFGVGQISSMNKQELSACKDKLLPYMEEVRTSYGLDMVFFMMTDIINESTELLMVGDMCKEVIENAFETTVESSSAELPGVVSRKKQLIPAILGQLS